MAVENTERSLKICEFNHCLPQGLYKTLLTASCLACPCDPIQFLKNALFAFQGHANLQAVDWKWKMFIVQRKRDAIELVQRMDMAERHFEKKCQHIVFTKWLIWVKLNKRAKIAVVGKLETLVNTRRLKRIIAAWHIVAKDSKRAKEYFKRLETSLAEINNRDHHIGERFDGLSALPENLSLKIFQYLDLRDWLNCSEVSYAWKSIIRSGTLWSQINVSVEKAWITDDTVKQILQNYRPFVIHLNLRGCTSLNWPSLKCISECRNLQELNVSECDSVTDTVVQRIIQGCPCLLYLNLSCTLITNTTLKEISRSCVRLQYLSLAYCCRFTDKGFLYLTTGTAGRNLLHLDLSGCTQMTVNGFRYISAGCPSLRQVVINDMPTLSDSCVLALLTRCCCLSTLSLLDAPHLSDVALKAIAETNDLRAFSIEGNNQLTDLSWEVLCSSSQALSRLHAAECPRMTDTSLRSVATLNNLQHLDISLCNRVSDSGIECLTKGSSANKLRTLNVSHCCHITDISVKRIAKRLCKLHDLSLSYCERLTDLALEWLSGSSICSLDITGCNIQDQGLAKLERICLKKIVLAECVYITDIGIEQFCRNVRDLEHVDVSHCVALSDGAVRAFSFYCRGLVVLRMAGCPKMTDMAVQYLTSGSLYLRELDVSGCSYLTDRSLRYLERICLPLSSIRMACCSGISRAAALKLQTRASYWEYSNDNPSH
ncbi:dynein regulatory complex subunit 6 [Nematolebias whitei]|uniref:dynein regulatory complex subunit 6 n=1 Tax=Nematolebias whitei TaxID=451745 RepID=UPI00189C4CB1|nr:dynein regulatory complex subunit 6 [Nematolebias whitei]